MCIRDRFPGDCADFLLRFHQKLLRVFHAKGQKVTGKGQARDFLETATKVCFIITEPDADLFRRKLPGETVIHVFQDLGKSLILLQKAADVFIAVTVQNAEKLINCLLYTSRCV